MFTYLVVFNSLKLVELVESVLKIQALSHQAYRMLLDVIEADLTGACVILLKAMCLVLKKQSF